MTANYVQNYTLFLDVRALLDIALWWRKSPPRSITLFYFDGENGAYRHAVFIFS